MDGLKRSLGLNKKPNDGMETKTLLETFRYPRLGPGMMWDAARDFRGPQRGQPCADGPQLQAAGSRPTATAGGCPPAASRWRETGQDQRRACHQQRADARACRPDPAEAADLVEATGSTIAIF
jgi:hypothetical protein